MRYVIGGLVLCAWLGFMGVSAVSNVSLATSWATTDQEWWALCVGALAADALKATMPVALLIAVQRRFWTGAIAAALLFAICQGFAGTAALSFASKTRTSFGDAQQIAATDRLKLEAKRDQAKGDLEWLPTTRPASVVEAELTAKEAEDRYKGSAGCTAMRSSYDTKFCRQVFALRQEIETAKNRAILTGRIDEIDRQLAGMTNLSGDVQLAAMQEITGADEKRIIAIMAIIVAVMVELGSALGLTVVAAMWAGERKLSVEKSPALPQAAPVAAVTPLAVVPAAREPSRRLAARLQPLAAVA